MDSVHHIWCPLSSQEYQDLPDGAETTLTKKLEAMQLQKRWPELPDGLTIQDKKEALHAMISAEERKTRASLKWRFSLLPSPFSGQFISEK
ncbi:hypothetical protein D4N02_26725 [Klebsiella pneumoniae]|uniref:hypothetical protein n=1 Tax=Klebsiella pneumoniae TaxID=573 RepID=UPI0011DD12BF|nr:hypothetical protein [Klebsiella pneumoniae]TXU20026.1 hypothetical protein D4N02_26725 [Klebsiella pneumoniae]